MPKNRTSQTATNHTLDLLERYFGSHDLALHFARRFAGVTLRIPTMSAIERAASEHQIAKVLQKDPSTEAVRRLASLQSKSMRAVAKIYSKQTGSGLKTIRARQAIATAVASVSVCDLTSQSQSQAA